MFLIFLAAILGGIATLLGLIPYSGVLIALGAAPFGASLLAASAGAFLAWRNRHVEYNCDFDEDNWDLDEAVADLKSIAEAGRHLDTEAASAISPITSCRAGTGTIPFRGAAVSGTPLRATPCSVMPETIS